MAIQGSNQVWHQLAPSKAFPAKPCVSRSLPLICCTSNALYVLEGCAMAIASFTATRIRHQTFSNTCLSIGRQIQDLYCRLIRSAEVHREGLAGHRMALEVHREGHRMDHVDHLEDLADHQKGLEALVGHRTPARSSSRK